MDARQRPLPAACPVCTDEACVGECGLAVRLEDALGSREYVRALVRFSPAPEPDAPMDRSRVRVVRIPPRALHAPVPLEAPAGGQARLVVA